MRREVLRIIQILKGNSWSLIKDFERRMKECAGQLRFEEAQEWKEKMELLEKHYAKSLIVNAKGINVDVFYIIFEGTEAFGSFLRVHDGGIIQSMNLEIRMRIEEQEPEVLGSFISGVYEKLRDYGEEAGTRPPEIVVPFMPDMPEALPEVTFTVPEKGDRLALLELGRKNAAAIKFERLKHEEFVNPEEHSARIVENLRKDLGMDVPPVHIECFDNSNIQGTNPVASCVVFRDGAPSRKDYRHFNIKTVVGPDDFRRSGRLRLHEGGGQPPLHPSAGRGAGAPAADRHRRRPRSGQCGLRGPGRDRAHRKGQADRAGQTDGGGHRPGRRFGITHHRNRRSASSLVSELDGIPGVGAVSREKLVTKYKTISKIKKAPYREVVNVIGRRAADALFEWFALDKS